MAAALVALAILAVAIPSFFFNGKPLKSPASNLPLTSQQQKISEEQNRMIETTKIQSDSVPSPEAIKKDTDKLIKEAEASGYGRSAEEIRKDQDNLINTSK